MSGIRDGRRMTAHGRSATVADRPITDIPSAASSVPPRSGAANEKAAPKRGLLRRRVKLLLALAPRVTESGEADAD